MSVELINKSTHISIENQPIQQQINKVKIQINDIIRQKRNPGIPLTKREIDFIIQNTENARFRAFIASIPIIGSIYRWISADNTVYRGYREFWTHHFNQNVRPSSLLRQDDSGLKVSVESIPHKAFEVSAISTYADLHSSYDSDYCKKYRNCGEVNRITNWDHIYGEHTRFTIPRHIISVADKELYDGPYESEMNRIQRREQVTWEQIQAIQGNFARLHQESNQCFARYEKLLINQCIDETLSLMPKDLTTIISNYVEI